MKKLIIILAAALVVVFALDYFHADASSVLIAPATTSESSGNTPVAVTCGNATEGAWTQLIASTAAVSYTSDLALLVNTGIVSATDIATGASASEVAIAKDFFLNTGQVVATYHVPITIPAGSRVSVRCYGSGAGAIIAGITVFE